MENFHPMSCRQSGLEFRKSSLNPGGDSSTQVMLQITGLGREHRINREAKSICSIFTPQHPWLHVPPCVPAPKAVCTDTEIQGSAQLEQGSGVFVVWKLWVHQCLHWSVRFSHFPQQWLPHTECFTWLPALGTTALTAGLCPSPNPPPSSPSPISTRVLQSPTFLWQGLRTHSVGTGNNWVWVYV